MKTAHTLDGDNLAGAQQRHGVRQRIAGHRAAVQVAQAEPGAAVRAGNWFGMKTPVSRLAVFAGAVGAQGKAGQAGVGAVIRQPAADAEARATVGAVDKRMPPAAVAGVEQLGQAGRARGQIRRQARAAACAGLAVDHGKPRFSLTRLHAEFSMVHLRQRRQRSRQRRQPGVQIGARAFQLDACTVAVIAHPAGQRPALAQPPDRRAQTHALHSTQQAQPQPRRIGQRRAGRQPGHHSPCAASCASSAAMRAFSSDTVCWPA